MSVRFADRLEERVLAGLAPVCIGLDPRPERLPDDLLPGAPPARRVVAFHREVLARIADRIPAVKPNVAFYETLGEAGWGAYVETCRLARDHGVVVIGDVKRGDIGSTAAAYAEAHFRLADAVTVNPYLGSDSLAPFLDACRRQGAGLFVLVRTSNPGSAEFQTLPLAAGGTVADAVARAVRRWGDEVDPGAGYSSVGAVVGATRSDAVGHFRDLMPRSWLLLPGVGAQGGDVADLGRAFDDRGLGGLVAQSRGILSCFEPDDRDWLDRVDQALDQFLAATRAAVSNHGSKRDSSPA